MRVSTGLQGEGDIVVHTTGEGYIQLAGCHKNGARGHEMGPEAAATPKKIKNLLSLKVEFVRGQVLPLEHLHGLQLKGQLV